MQLMNLTFGATSSYFHRVSSVQPAFVSRCSATPSSRYPGKSSSRVKRPSRHLDDQRAAVRPSIDNRRESRPSADKYFVPQDYDEDSESTDESESDYYSDEDDTEKENTNLPQASTRKGEAKKTVKSFFQKLRSRRVGDSGSSSNSRTSTRANGQDVYSEAEDSAEFSDGESASDYSEDEKEASTSSSKVSVKSYLEKLRARRLERKTAENKVIDELPPVRRRVKLLVSKQPRESTSEGRQEHRTKQEKLSTPSELKTSSETSDVTEEKPRRRRSHRGSKSKQEVKRQDAFYSVKSFRKLGASHEIIDALSSLEITRPSEIQALSFNEVLRGNSCIIADQTGSGKTLAYLAPLVQRLREQEENGTFSTPKNPRILILVPTSELAMQVLNVCRALARKSPFKSMVATGGFKWKTQVESLENGPDVVVATPGRFLHHFDEKTIELNKLQSVVLDEVDILFEEEEFLDAMHKVRRQASEALQYIHVTATLPTDVHDRIINMQPDSVPLLGPGLHLTAPGLNEILVDCSGGDDDQRTPESAFENKRVALLNLLQESSVSKTIVFCNKIETCRKVENVLKRYDRSGKRLSVLPYHAALSQEARLQSMQDFLTLQPEVSMFLVCTDRASRGLDSVGVERVILFDFPRDPSEYIRRVGRTARAGGAGKVFVFVVGKQVSLAKKVMARNEKRHPVHSVPGANNNNL